MNARSNLKLRPFRQTHAEAYASLFWTVCLMLAWSSDFQLFHVSNATRTIFHLKKELLIITTCLSGAGPMKIRFKIIFSCLGH